MPCQAKTEVLEYFHLSTIDLVFQAHNLLYQVGYRGTLTTTGDSASLQMSLAGAVPVSVVSGDVILYRPPATVVNCLSHEEFTARFDIL